MFLFIEFDSWKSSIVSWFINIDLYFLVNGLFFTENYLNEMFNDKNINFAISVETDEETGVSQVVVSEIRWDNMGNYILINGKKSNEVKLNEYIESYFESLNAEYIKNYIGEYWEAQQEP